MENSNDILFYIFFSNIEKKNRNNNGHIKKKKLNK